MIAAARAENGATSPGAGRELANSVAAYRGGVNHYMRRRGFSPDEAEDLTQETLLRACMNAHHFRGVSLGAWVFRIAANLAVDQIRRHRPTFVDMKDLEERPAEGSDPCERVLRQATHQQLRRMIAELPCRYQQLIQLRYFEDRSMDEIARVTECTPGIAKQRVFRAVSALRRRWQTA